MSTYTCFTIYSYFGTKISFSNYTSLCNVVSFIEFIIVNTTPTTIQCKVFAQCLNQVYFVHISIGKFRVQTMVTILNSCFIPQCMSDIAIKVPFMSVINATNFCFNARCAKIYLRFTFCKLCLWCSTYNRNTHCSYSQ